MAAFLLGFTLLVVGVTYLLWPRPAKPTAPAGPGPVPAVQAPVVQEPQKNLAEILNEAPRNAGQPPGAGRPAGVPRFDPPAVPDIGIPGPGFANPRQPGVAPAFPPLGPAPAPVAGGPKLADVVPLPLKSARLANDFTEIPLPGPVESSAVAGGGRLLLLHVPSKQKVAVFDVSDAKIVKEIDAPAGDTMLAGGMNMFVIYQPKKNIIERWSCEKLERQPDVASPFTDPVRALAMGSASNGPLVAALGGSRNTIHRGATLDYFDPTTMKVIGYTQQGDRNAFGSGIRDTPVSLRVSANGTVVTAGNPTGTGAECVVIRGNLATKHWQFGGPKVLLPSADGRFLCAADEIVTTDLPDHVNHLPRSTYYIPAVQGDAYLAVRGDGFGFLDGEPRPASVDIFQVGKQKPAATFASVEDVDMSQAEVGLDRTMFLIADAKVLITIAAPKRNKLILRRVEFK